MRPPPAPNPSVTCPSTCAAHQHYCAVAQQFVACCLATARDLVCEGRGSLNVAGSVGWGLLITVFAPSTEAAASLPSQCWQTKSLLESSSLYRQDTPTIMLMLARFHRSFFTNRLSFEELLDDSGYLHGWWQARLIFFDMDEKPWYSNSGGEEPEYVRDIHVRLLSKTMIETQIKFSDDNEWQPPVIFTLQHRDTSNEYDW